LRTILISLVFVSTTFVAQNTIGTISVTEDAYDGYTLFTAFTETYLINNCGEVINQWSSAFPPGNAVYLREDGSLLRAGRTDSDAIVFGGVGGVVEIFDWNGNLTWQHFFDDNQLRQHHDVYPMPNGNILVLLATVMTDAEAIQAGRDPSKLTQNRLYNERIIEIIPTGSSSYTTVWEWNINDHLVQDFDASKDNFGNVSQSPNKLDINFLNGFNPVANWLHINSIQYDEQLDQIIMSSRNMSEIYIIDHSTTTAEAATSNGGIYGKGGDFLYRWGNPQAYDQGSESDQKLFGQHFPNVVRDYQPYDGKVIVFNNGLQRLPQFSQVDLITPPTTSPGVYDLGPQNVYGPSSTDFTYTSSPEPTDFYSAILSSAQVLPNGNILVCEGRGSYFFELDTAYNIVWEYISPVSNLSDQPLPQGSPPSTNNNCFRAIKYPTDYAPFLANDTTPGLPIELNPDLTPCNNLTTENFSATEIRIYPNPTSSAVHIESSFPISRLELYNLSGQLVKKANTPNDLNLEAEQSGVYLLKVYHGKSVRTEKVIKR